MNKTTVSIIIVSYNTKDVLINCINSINKYGDISYEIIVSDNGSMDGTVEDLKRKKYNVKLIENNANLGFAKANNIARSVATGEYILFLNPDTLLHEKTLKETIEYMDKNKRIGALTPKVILPDGSLDKDTRRSFPTPYIALTHFSGLDKIFPKSKSFSKYWYGYIDENTTHEIDALQGAYLLTRKEVLDEVNWFDEDYFLDGEDIDLCFKIKAKGYKIIYYPFVSITHIKKASKKKNKSLRSVIGGVRAMEIFYRKRMWSRYPFIVNIPVILGIKMLVILRTIKFYLFK